MGVFELAGRVITTYKADISQMKASLKDLSGAEKELMKARIEATEAGNQALENQVKGIQKTAVHLAAFAGTVYAAKKGYEEWREYTRQATAATGADIDKLSDAAGGLLTKMDLLSFAAKENHGAWKLNNGEMEDVLHAWRALVKEGNDAEQTLQDLSQAVKENKTEALEKYGIAVTKTSDDLQRHRNILESLRGEYKKFGGDVSMEGDEVERAGVKFSDSMSTIKIKIGEIVVALGPLIDGVANLVEKVSNLVPSMESLRGFVWNSDKLSLDLAANDQKIMADDLFGSSYIATWNGSRNVIERQSYSTADRVMAGEEQGPQTGVSHEDNPIGDTFNGIIANVRSARALALYIKKKKADLAKVWGEGGTGDLTDVYFSRHPLGDDIVGPDLRLGLAAGELPDFGQGGSLAVINQLGGRARADLAAMESERQSREARYAGFASRGAQSWAEQHFGKLEDFDAYARGFSVLEDASTSALNAWISGSESLGDALKKAISTGLAATSVQLGIEALKHGAYAIG
ncbi:MAG TPA: hypothetical protein VL199_09710, partial [Burkholderiales bacterium]|nr:hypothetical protein [Burkholderiales bacterium]